MPHAKQPAVAGPRLSRGTALFTLLLVAAFAALSSAAAESTAPKIAEDRSLTTDQYVIKGLPDPAQLWSAADYKRAHQILAALAKSDPRGLPRFGSPQSGKVFARLTAPENFDPIADKTVALEQRYARYTGYAPFLDIVRLYMKANDAKLGAFDSELLELYAQLLRLHLAGAHWGEDFLASIPANDPTRPQRLRAVAERRSAGAQLIRDPSLKAFSNPAFRKTELRRFAQTLQTIVPAFAVFCPAETRTAIATDLKELESAEEDADLRAAIHTLRDAVDKNAPAGL